MKETAKKILKWAGLYHPLQSAYRQILFFAEKNISRIQFSKYKGAGFTCNVCGRSYTKFKDDFPSAENAAVINFHEVIAGYGKNIICPCCLSNARERLVIQMLKEMDISGKKILHVSPEKNVYNFIRHSAAVTTADITPGFYKSIDRNILRQDATHFSFPDQSFDLVISNHILEHIPEDEKAMKEIYRVLKKKGQAVLQVPYSAKNKLTIEDKNICDPVLQSELFGQNDHVRIYALDDYISRLKNAGFEVEIVTAEELARFKIFAIQESESFFQIKKVSV